MGDFVLFVAWKTEAKRGKIKILSSVCWEKSVKWKTSKLRKIQISHFEVWLSTKLKESPNPFAPLTSSLGFLVFRWDALAVRRPVSIKVASKEGSNSSTSWVEGSPKKPKQKTPSSSQNPKKPGFCISNLEGCCSLQLKTRKPFHSRLGPLETTQVGMSIPVVGLWSQI